MDIGTIIEQMDTCAKRLILHLNHEPRTIKQIADGIYRDTKCRYEVRDLSHWVNFFCVDGFVSRVERGEKSAPLICLDVERGHRLQSKIRASRPSTSPNV